MRFKLAIFLLLLAVIPTALWLPKAMYKPKVFDCFPFFNELDVLEVRLEELYEKVDKRPTC